MKKYLIIITIGSLLLTSCEYLITCLDGNGEMETEQRIGGNFTSITVEGEYNVVVENSPTISVEVTADENLLEYIETTVRGGKLTVTTNHDGCITFDDETEVLVRCPILTNISHLGSGNVEVYDFYVDNLNVVAAGSGHVTMSNVSVSEDLDVSLIGSGNVWLKGRANKGFLSLSGSGNIDSEAMRVFESYVTVTGSGNVHTYAYDALKVTLAGSGNVYYYGNPKDVVTNVTGSGEVINRSNVTSN